MTDIDATQVYKAFSHDVTAAILVSQNNETSGIYAKGHLQIMLLFVYTTTCKVCNFHM